MRTLAFVKRNLKEIIIDPLSIIFNIGFPIVLLLVFQLIKSAIPDAVLGTVPHFQIGRLAPSMALFGFSFVTLFSGFLVSKDRSTSFLARLRTSPLTSTEFLAGYTLPLIPITFIQVVLIYLVSIFLGFKITVYTLLSVLSMIPIALFFIGCGLLFGTVFNEKSVGGVSSIIVNVAAILGGIFMPLDTMTGTFKNICYALPFANSLRMTQCIINNDYTDFWRSFIIVMIYAVIVVTLAIFFFKKKMNSDKI